ncbi:DMT family transporter [soil metagenome]
MSFQPGPRPAWLFAAPALFIFIWSTGYIAAKYVVQVADPLTFLCVRYAGSIVLMVALAAWARATWPSRADAWRIALAGILMQALYLGGVWTAVRHGMSAGVAALIVNLQPVLTAAAGPLIGERVSARQWGGLGLGVIGVALVVSNKVADASMPLHTVGLTLLSLFAITSGLLYQKRHVPAFDLRAGQAIQFTASLVVTLPFAWLLEDHRFDINATSLLTLAWSVFVLTGIGISLLFLMMRHGDATRVTSYMYLAPAVTALMAWPLFGETFGVVALIGMVITIAGVALVVTRGARGETT